VTVPGNLDRAPAGADAGDIQARLMLVTLCLIWGLTWPMMKIALNEIPPFSMRTLTAGIGALVLIAICIVKRRSLRVPVGKAWVHVVVASLLNMVGFTVLSAFAQIAAATSRVAILTYAMPIWAMLLTWVILRERPTRIQGVALALCVLGLGVLIRPLATTGIPLGLLLAIGSGFSWAAGTVYVKWARIDADPMGVASWQVTIAFFIIGACLCTSTLLTPTGCSPSPLPASPATRSPMPCGSRSCAGSVRSLRRSASSAFRSSACSPAC